MMKSTRVLPVLVSLLAATASTAFADDAKIRIVPAATSKWADVGGMPKGVQATLLFGDPKVGPHIVLLTTCRRRPCTGRAPRPTW
jgi:hypothetical protein